MQALKQQWINQLASRKAQHTYRSLTPYSPGIDFRSNDYLGLAKDIQFSELLLEQISSQADCLQGSTGSRLISGNSALAEDIESFIAREHEAAAALFFSSGYKANLALFSCMLSRADTLIVDEYIHRSVHDGCQLSAARKWKFRHNDVDHLESLLQKASGNVVVAIESLYSVDGNFAPLTAIVRLTQKYNAGLIVDEAHAMGVFGKGLVHQYGLQQEVLATVVTYGKAMGLEGAVVLGDQVLKDYLVNYASPFIYSTAPSALHLLRIQCAYQYIAAQQHLAITLSSRIEFFSTFRLHKGSEPGSPIQIIRFSNTHALLNLHLELKKHGLLTYPLFSPTVAEGQERLRICLHSFNTEEEINALCSIIKKYAYVT
ncbi:MAG: 8-amino-7-oxononanoate synthase [Bacteroidetes bacterium 43-16]|nr:MAG: 8-amino-7-oxononanoate synthase [Bacteroidetes bacterium 43-16]